MCKMCELPNSPDCIWQFTFMWDYTSLLLISGSSTLLFGYFHFVNLRMAYVISFNLCVTLG